MKVNNYMKKKLYIKNIFINFFIFTIPLAAVSNEFQSNDNTPLAVHGFMTTGAVQGDNKISFRNGINRRINYVYDSKFGITITKRFNEKWDLAAQYLSQFSPMQKIFDVDWALASYYPVEGLSLQFGKYKMPISLISDYDGIGRTYPWVRPPTEVYSLDPVQRLYGAKAAYEHDLGPFRGEATVFGGETKGSILRDLSDTVMTLKYDANNALGLGFSLENDLFLIRTSYQTSTISLVSDLFTIHKFILEYLSFGLKMEWEKWLLYTEYLKAKSKTSDADKTAADQGLAKAKTPDEMRSARIQKNAVQNPVLNNEAYYVTLGYSFFDTLMLAATYSELKNIQNKKSLFYDKQSSKMLTMKYDINRYIDLKFEYQRTDIPNDSIGLYTYNESKIAKKDLAKKINIYSVAMDFVF
jgi:hypothetical protein